MLVEKIGHVEADWFGAKICLAKILITINFSTHLVTIQKNCPHHKVLVNILVKKIFPMSWPALVLARHILAPNQLGS